MRAESEDDCPSRPAARTRRTYPPALLGVHSSTPVPRWRRYFRVNSTPSCDATLATAPTPSRTLNRMRTGRPATARVRALARRTAGARLRTRTAVLAATWLPSTPTASARTPARPRCDGTHRNVPRPSLKATVPRVVAPADRIVTTARRVLVAT